MKIGYGGIANVGTFGISSAYLGQPHHLGVDSDFRNHVTDSDHSALIARNINSSIGLLQSAIATLDRVINDSMDIKSSMANISGATFFGKPIFVTGSTINDDFGNVVFDFGKVLDVVSDSDDINVLKRYLRQENDVLKNYLSILRDSIDDSDDVHLDNDFLVSNSSLFSKSHNLSNLSSKIDSLLA